MSEKYDVLVFTKAPSAYEPSRIKSEAGKMGIKSQIVAYSDLNFFIQGNGIEVDWKGERLSGADAVIFRAAGGDGFYIPQRDFLIDWFEDKGGIVLNSETYKAWSRLDKITQHFEFMKAKFPIISTRVYGRNDLLVEKENNYPYIVKKSLSSRGKDVFKIENKNEIDGLYSLGYFARNMLTQPFLRAGEDLRIIVLGGRALGGMKRIAQPGKYLTNYSQGGLVENYDLSRDNQARNLAEKVAKHFYLDYVGVDLMRSDEGEWKVLEVNRACQFKGFEASTGMNVAKSVIEFLLKRK